MGSNEKDALVQMTRMEAVVWVPMLSIHLPISTSRDATDVHARQACALARGDQMRLSISCTRMLCALTMRRVQHSQGGCPAAEATAAGAEALTEGGDAVPASKHGRDDGEEDVGDEDDEGAAVDNLLLAGTYAVSEDTGFLAEVGVPAEEMLDDNVVLRKTVRLGCDPDIYKANLTKAPIHQGPRG